MRLRRVLWLGFYDPGYSRNRVLLKGLRALGVEVEECRVDPRRAGTIGKYVRLLREAWSRRRGDWDVVAVAHPGLNAVWIAALLFPRRVVYDAFYSFYQSEVEDRGTARRGSFRAAALYAAEWLSLRMARFTLIDTSTHARYFAKTYGRSEASFIRVPIGADDAIFRPSDAAREGAFVVEFHGSFIPLQGIDVILRAAKILDAEGGFAFRLIGSGQTFRAMRALAGSLALTNAEFLGPLPQSGDGPNVVAEMARADAVLGIFGTGRKTGMVVPNKVYEGMACARPVVTADTEAVRELLACGKEVLCVPAGDPEALAAALRKLKGDAAFRASLAEAGYRVYAASFVPRVLAEGLKRELEARWDAVDGAGSSR